MKNNLQENEQENLRWPLGKTVQQFYLKGQIPDDCRKIFQIGSREALTKRKLYFASKERRERGLRNQHQEEMNKFVQIVQDWDIDDLHQELNQDANQIQTSGTTFGHFSFTERTSDQDREPRSTSPKSSMEEAPTKEPPCRGIGA